MGGAAIEVTIDDAPFRGALTRLASFGEAGLSPALDAIGAAMVTSTALRFDAGAGPGGIPWLPSQRVRRKGGKTLILSGRLWHSITHNVIGNAVEWGTNVIYAAIHQFGGTIEREAGSHTIYHKAKAEGIEPGFVKKSKSNFARDVLHAAFKIVFPARPYIGIDNEDVAEMDDILGRALGNVIAGGSTT